MLTYFHWYMYIHIWVKSGIICLPTFIGIFVSGWNLGSYAYLFSLVYSYLGEIWNHMLTYFHLGEIWDHMLTYFHWCIRIWVKGPDHDH